MQQSRGIVCTARKKKNVYSLFPAFKRVKTENSREVNLFSTFWGLALLCHKFCPCLMQYQLDWKYLQLEVI